MIDVVFHHKKLKIVIDTLIILSISIECTFRKLLIWIYRFKLTNFHSQTNKYYDQQIIKHSTLNTIAHVFWSSSSIIDECVRLLKRWDFKFNVVQYQMSAAYKWKTNKMQFIDWVNSNENCFEKIINWKKWILKEKLKSVLWQESDLNLYKHLITLKFSDIAQDVWFTSEHVQKLKINSQLTSVKQDILMTILFNREKAQSWYFNHIKKIRLDVVSSQKIWTIEHET